MLVSDRVESGHCVIGMCPQPVTVGCNSYKSEYPEAVSSFLMPPKAAPGELGRGGRGGRRGGARGGGRGGRGPSPSHSGPPTPGSAPQSGGFPTRATPVSGGPAVQRSLIPAAHVSAIGVRRTGKGTAGWPVKVLTNNFAIELNQGTIYHYDGMYLFSPRTDSLNSASHLLLHIAVVISPADRPLPAARNFEIIQTLQTQVEPALFARPGVYDGRKNLFTAYELPFESGGREFSIPIGTGVFAVRLTHVASIDLKYDLNLPRVLQRFLQGEQRHDNTVLTAITIVKREISVAELSCGVRYFQSIYRLARCACPGHLIDVALAILGRPGNPMRLRHVRDFPTQIIAPGLKITASYNQRDPNQATRPRVVRRLSREGARDLTFELAGGQPTTVADYFRQTSQVGIDPVGMCHVPPGQIMRKQVPPDKTNSVLEFATKRPHDRLGSIINGLGVLDYNQSEYVREFGMTVANEPTKVQARILDAPKLRYHQSSEEPRARPRDGAWNLIDKRMFTPSSVAHWMIIIYERQQRFNDQVADQMASDLVRACEAVGMSINPQPALIKWESGQGNIGQQLRAASDECKRRVKSLPTLVVVVLPEGGNDIYSAAKHFGDVARGVVTQCMKSSKCFRAKPQYYANITLKLNVKLGGVNSVPESRDISSLIDPTNLTIVMGAHVIHPAPGSGDRPSFTSLVGSIDTNAVRYVSTMEVQTSRQEIIDAMESMSTYVLTQYKLNMGRYPKRILFYRGSVSEGQFVKIVEDELPFIRSTNHACKKLGINPIITLIVVGGRHHVRFFPRFTSESDRSGNCFVGTVVDSDIVNPVGYDFYLQSHSGVLGTSCPTHYNVLIDENRFTADDLQSITRKTRVLPLETPLRPATGPHHIRDGDGHDRGNYHFGAISSGISTNTRASEKFDVLLLSGALSPFSCSNSLLKIVPVVVNQ
ncbi:argonaute-like protein [Lactarius sanguifluus]|nr:argonaute-like protein [Lactarius sanguifluus]